MTVIYDGICAGPSEFPLVLTEDVDACSPTETVHIVVQYLLKNVEWADGEGMFVTDDATPQDPCYVGDGGQGCYGASDEFNDRYNLNPWYVDQNFPSVFAITPVLAPFSAGDTISSVYTPTAEFPGKGPAYIGGVARVVRGLDAFNEQISPDNLPRGINAIGNVTGSGSFGSATIDETVGVGTGGQPASKGALAEGDPLDFTDTSGIAFAVALVHNEQRNRTASGSCGARQISFSFSGAGSLSDNAVGTVDWDFDTDVVYLTGSEVDENWTPDLTYDWKYAMGLKVADPGTSLSMDAQWTAPSMGSIFTDPPGPTPFFCTAHHVPLDVCNAYAHTFLEYHGLPCCPGVPGAGIFLDPRTIG